MLLDPAFLVAQLLNSLQLAMLLFLLAIGLSVIFGLMNFLNLAHGTIYMLSAFIAYSVAQHLGGLIGGAGTNGQVFVEFFHNDKNTRRNSTLRFEDPAQALDLSRLVVITTRGSASASESVINSLRPFLPVTVVGDTTYGKPVGQYGFDFCDQVLYPVAFAVRNAQGQGDYFGGIPADCPAADDLDHPLGDSAEASVAEALHYLRTGGCSGQAAAARQAHARRSAAFTPLPADGWQQLVNAW